MVALPSICGMVRTYLLGTSSSSGPRESLSSAWPGSRASLSAQVGTSPFSTLIQFQWGPPGTPALAQALLRCPWQRFQVDNKVTG